MTMRQQIVTALDTRLKGILVASGYASNLGQHVYPWRTRPLSPTEDVALIYRDTIAQKTAAEVGRHQHTLIVEISIISQEDSPAESMRDMVGDVAAAIGSDPRFGGLARWSRIASDQLTVIEDSGALAGSAITLEITYTTGLFEV